MTVGSSAAFRGNDTDVELVRAEDERNCVGTEYRTPILSRPFSRTTRSQSVRSSVAEEIGTQLVLPI